jgi:hypothetical protein
MKQLRETIQRQQAVHNDSLYDVEKKAVLDKDRWVTSGPGRFGCSRLIVW